MRKSTFFRKIPGAVFKKKKEMAKRKIERKKKWLNPDAQ